MVESLKKIYHSHEKTLLACSGGPDSTALFYLLLELKKQGIGFDFQVFHLNHCLRGEKGKEDAFFVQNLCEKFSILFHGKEEDVAFFAKQNKLSLEEAGRIIRYRELNEIRVKQDLNSISTAHHADDQRELFLMRLFQGAGINALTGMKARKGIYVRPLLEFKKSDIIKYLEENKILFQKDETNEKNDFLRNKIRNQLIPVLSEIFPVYDEKIHQFQKILNRQHQFITKNLIPWKKITGQCYLSLLDFKDVPEELQREELLLGLKTLGQNYSLSTKNLENILELIQRWDQKGHKIFLETKDFCFLGSQGVLFFISREFLNENEEDFVLKPAEKKIFFSHEIENNSMVSLFFRKPAEGEKVKFEKTKKLQDFLTDEKIYYHWKKKVRIIETEEKKFSGIIEPVSGQLYLSKEFQGSLNLKYIS